jgi:hypothetical protein
MRVLSSSDGIKPTNVHVKPVSKSMTPEASSSPVPASLLAEFVAMHHELNAYK